MSEVSICQRRGIHLPVTLKLCFFTCCVFIPGLLRSAVDISLAMRDYTRLYVVLLVSPGFCVELECDNFHGFGQSACCVTRANQAKLAVASEYANLVQVRIVFKKK